MPNINSNQPKTPRPTMLATSIQTSTQAPRLPTHLKSAAVKACTTEVPSTNLVLKIRFAFWNMPSFKLTTMNWLPLKRVLIKRPIFCVWERSRAASTSSRMYMGAGLNWRRAMMRERAMRDLLECQLGFQERLLWGKDLPLSTTQLSERLFPDFTERDFDFQTLGNCLTLWRVEFGKTTRQ